MKEFLEKSNNKEKLITVGVAMVILILLMFLFINNAKETQKKNTTNTEDPFALVTDYHMYFFVSKNINNYITTTDKNKLYSLLYSGYKEKNNITIGNIDKYVGYVDADYFYRIKELISYNIDDVRVVYHATGTIYQEYDDSIVKEKAEYMKLYKRFY